MKNIIKRQNVAIVVAVLYIVSLVFTVTLTCVKFDTVAIIAAGVMVVLFMILMFLVFYLAKHSPIDTER